MKKPYVLSVEDNRSDIALMERVFEKEIPNCNVSHIEDGESAIQYFESMQFADHPPKCILMDIKLPKMNGLEVLNYLRNKKMIKNIPVIILSSSDRPEEIIETYALGGNSYIEKPKTYADLKEQLPKIIQYWTTFNKAPQEII
ncbi:response regulator [Aquimarina sp. U1-2]|uniref:response regulator n=1 Tax=Aquimarina sp. U1-2 TaxID=2823141 RepID=UPI001AECC998|nr:response regulator [Aquimarina sp. U1-2]MBP2830701.1 response regulator [Aquimarina sp. U1-2]